MLSEEELHDPATLSLSEAQDGWLVQGYVYEGSAVMSARPYEGASLSAGALISVVRWAEYASVVETARRYWAQEDGRFRSVLWRAKVARLHGEN
ncbi:hypothetical protein [Actinacidiphila sp. bgisy144]|uniref:hypothetical protein n=1 Tax=Actinacidiphila sp. bgisy144 TaxID=3413791 RepID=UPI003EB96D86